METFSDSAVTRTLALFAIIALSLVIAQRCWEYYDDFAYGKAHGCQLPPKLPNRWPLGVDRLKQLWQSNAEGRLLAFLSEVSKDYEPGNNLYQYLMFGPRAYQTLHPKNVEAILSTDFKDYGLGLRYNVCAPLLGHGLFTQEGSDWKHSRELLRKQFARAKYQNLDSFKEHVDNFIARVPLQGVLDLQPLFFKLTLDTTTALLLGQSVYSLKADRSTDTKNDEFAESFNIAQEGLAKRFRIAPFQFFYNPQSFRKACSIVHRFVDSYIEERITSDQREQDTKSSSGFLDELVVESGSTQYVRDQILSVLLAGRDSTACCLSWAFRLLVRFPKVQARLREEIRSVLGDSQSLTREQTRQMPYLACVIKETLRLYPSAPLNNREAIRRTMLPTGGGPDGNSPILVRKGELVIFSQYVNSRKKNLYGPDAEEFRPERWETGELDDIGWGYFPFSGGPRSCLGQDFASMEISYTIVRLLQAFSRFSLPGDEPSLQDVPIGQERQRLTLVVSCAEGCRVDVQK